MAETAILVCSENVVEVADFLVRIGHERVNANIAVLVPCKEPLFLEPQDAALVDIIPFIERLLRADSFTVYLSEDLFVRLYRRMQIMASKIEKI